MSEVLIVELKLSDDLPIQEKNWLLLELQYFQK